MILNYSPDQYNEFVEDCIKYLFNHEKGRKLAEHEAAHFDALRRLGHSPESYVIILSESSDPFLMGASIDFDKEKVSARDLAIAALAPRDPSNRDLRTASKVFSKSERRQIWKGQQEAEE